MCACVCFQLLILPNWNTAFQTNLFFKFKKRKQVADYEVKSTSMPIFTVVIVGLKMKYRHGSESTTMLFLNKGEMHLLETNTNLAITMVTKMCALYIH